jgi:large subunit ribosomal protein L24
MKIKKGDNVKVVIGKDKGKTGKVEKVFSKENKVVVSGVNLYKRHMKARSQNQPSEIITLVKPLPVSNIMLICPKCHKETRVGYRIEKGVKSRTCAKCESKI